MTDGSRNRYAQHCVMLQTDAAGSVFGERGVASTRLAYTAYGQLPDLARIGLLGFTGQMLQRDLQGYLLGNGHRLYNPQLMRFVCPDTLSPFGEGGVNTYAYCEGDPVNNVDPSGRIAFPNILKFLRLRSRTGVTGGAKKLGMKKSDLKTEYRKSTTPTEGKSITEHRFLHEDQPYIIVRSLGGATQFGKHEAHYTQTASKSTILPLPRPEVSVIGSTDTRGHVVLGADNKLYAVDKNAAVIRNSKQ
ncbi:RHS repeat-associated core domain-containing protein [Pseudomonas sichuanensis]|uniref:RHS repeat-associated core domain-containing protein n=1 Tax=Pseudomonas sichuanensis TaxID=2213015 RepID=UPI00244D2D4B|nr:RHS repeat-associated core domain-containing protein [Pseudomonas sichuanensis]MDH0729347.1 RHS repeat-associated core domain-containing protein [Pseudomonas sichuanensis]MDH1581693.1 RHS repeat-associated core domain-containing protein [Pseudomonas sichuanensis]MDH1591982.1 RHS repeat-associated core domain-containing protein [Pseudomonas sichuanensis]MDH1597548.1 RHS repeat-associated core domain-containing protein [Pseudomonas sichuanensis]